MRSLAAGHHVQVQLSIGPVNVPCSGLLGFGNRGSWHHILLTCQLDQNIVTLWQCSVNSSGERCLTGTGAVQPALLARGAVCAGDSPWPWVLPLASVCGAHCRAPSSAHLLCPAARVPSAAEPYAKPIEKIFIPEFVL